MCINQVKKAFTSAFSCVLSFDNLIVFRLIHDKWVSSMAFSETPVNAIGVK